MREGRGHSPRGRNGLKVTAMPERPTAMIQIKSRINLVVELGCWGLFWFFVCLLGFVCLFVLFLLVFTCLFIWVFWGGWWGFFLYFKCKFEVKVCGKDLGLKAYSEQALRE